MSNSAQHIRNLARQIDRATDCEVLLSIINSHTSAASNALSELIKGQSDVLSAILPIIKPPKPTPGSLLRWVKKSISSTLKPQLKSLLSMAKEIIQISSALASLANSITNAKTKLEQCALETVPAVLNQEINATIRNLRAPLDNTLLQINFLQDRIENVTNVPLSARIDTSSPEAFARTADTAFRSIEAQVDSFVSELDAEDDAEPDPTPPLDGEVPLSSGETLVIENGLIIEVKPPEGP